MNPEDHLGALTSALDQSTIFFRRWDGVIDHWTKGCEALYGWAAQEAVGRVSHQLLNTRFPENLEEIKRKLLESGIWQGELHETRRDGTPLLISARWVLLPGTSNQIRTILATQTDITPRLRIQQELESANERLKSMAAELARSNEELAEFARIASHDLSAPIVTTRWLVDLLSSRYQSKLDPEGIDCLRQVARGLDRMSDLVDAVLAHALAGSRSIRSSQPTSSEEALRAAIENLQKDFETANATLTHDPMPELLIAPAPLTQLFQNLLSNAIKYRRPDSAPQIRITAERQEGFSRIGVHDNGIGIEPAWHERIFLPLQRRHGMEISGSGIGLATCKKIVTRAGGQIWVESRVGEGSVFFFTIPALLGSEHPSPAFPTPPEHT